MHPRVRYLIPSIILCLVAGCFKFWQTEPKPTRDPQGHLVSTSFRTPVKAHLRDGSTIIFPDGASLDSISLSGRNGRHYALLRDTFTARSEVRLDSIVGIETFDKKTLVGPMVATSIVMSVVATAGTIFLLKAVFGSCPTIYADTAAGTPAMLQAEGFSYAIAPLFEHRDVDALNVHRDADGRIRLELRNEALETHFINHLELLEVRHEAGSRAVPDQFDSPVVVGAVRPLSRAVDRAGRDVRDVLSGADGRLYATAPSVTANAKVGDLEDWIDVEADDLPPGDSIAVVLRLRNSLLNTVLLYDGMLGGRDAVDFLASASQSLASGAALSQWYVETLGMRARVDELGRPSTAPHARLSDVGPIAFRDVAIVLPRPRHDATSVRVRLSFVADNWRIDRAEMGATVSRANITSIGVQEIIAPMPAVGTGPRADTAAKTAVREPDGRYLETVPGQRMTLVFAPPPASSAQSTTYFIAWQGYYTEWIRGSWLASPKRPGEFVLGDEAMLNALRSWTARQKEMERAFYSTKIPVR